MAFEIPKQRYSGKIGETTLGTGSGAITVGGEESYPFHLFEGAMPSHPKIAMEIWDYDPSEEWPAAALAPFKDVISSPDAWAKKCVDEFGADMIVLQLKSTDPNAMDRDADEAAEVTKKVLEAINVPLVVWGTANNEKDEEVLKKVAETCEGKNLALAPVEEGCYKGVGASALGYNHTIVASTPIDVNLAKQLNVLLGNLGVQSEKILIDPTTGGLGYGLEYSYSVMERIRMAALTQEDEKLQIPMISNIGNEIWKCKEAGQPIEEAPTMGDAERRGILMETVAAVSYLLAGSDIVILRHPESVRLTRSFIELMTNGGMASDVNEIAKHLELKEADLVSISPEPNLAIEEKEVPAEEKVAKPKKEEAPPKAEEKVVELKPKEEEVKEERPKAKAEPKAAPKAEEKVVELKPKAEEAAEAREKEKAEAEAKAQEEAKKKAEAEAKAKAEEEARKKAEEEAKARAEAEAKTRAEEEAKAKEKEELQALRYKRALEREKLEAERKALEGKEIPKTPSKVQMTLVDKLIQDLDRIHRRS